MQKGLSALRRGAVFVCAALLGLCAEAVTELDYSGEVYCYETCKGSGWKEAQLYSIAGDRFEACAAPASLKMTDARFVAVPVILKSGSITYENIKLSLEGLSYPGELSSARSLYSDKQFMELVCPRDVSKWEDHGDVWSYETGADEREWPRDVWPEKTSVPGRHWILVQVNGVNGNWSGLTHLKIEVSDDVNGSFDPVVIPLSRGMLASEDGFPCDKIFGGSSMAVKSFSKLAWVTFEERPEAYATGLGPWFDCADAMEDKTEINIDVLEAGILRVVYLPQESDGEIQEFHVKGNKNIVGDPVITDIGKKYEEGHWEENVYVGELYAKCLEVEVSKATTLTVYSGDGEDEEWTDGRICEISFRPTGVPCARVIADYVETCSLADGCGMSYLRGYVLGGGVYKSGETVALTAVAGNTAVFDHWESDDIILPSSVATNATLSFEVPADKCSDDGTAEIKIRAVWRDRRLPDEVVGVFKAWYGPFAPGKQVSLDFPELVGYAANGLPAGLKFDAKTGTISGAATKPTDETGVTVTFTKNGAEPMSTRFIVGPFPELSVKVGDGGTVTGAGSYAAGKKAKLTAKAAKGYVFAGWYTDAAFNTPLVSDVDYRTPSLQYVMPTEGKTIYARFVPSSEDEEISLYVVGDSRVLATENASDVAFQTSGEMTLSLDVKSASLPKIKVSGLPKGLKFTAKRLFNRDGSVLAEANTVYGAVTKPGTYIVTVKLANATVKKAIERRFTIAGDNLTSANVGLRVTDANGDEVSLQNAPGQMYVVRAGVAEHGLPSISGLGVADKVTLSGLPAGLKYDAKTGRITGAAKKAGMYTVTATVTLVSTFTVEVEQ